MLRKFLVIARNRSADKFRNHLENVGILFLEEEQANAWAFYDSSSGEWETSVREMLEQLEIVSFRISIED